MIIWNGAIPICNLYSLAASLSLSCPLLLLSQFKNSNYSSPIMCSGHILRYNCGHEKRTYYFRCFDGRNEHRQELLPHRMVGLTYCSRRLCCDCDRDRRDEEEQEQRDRERQEVRAKALLEFLRGERPWPRPDLELSWSFRHAYTAGNRLHPWLHPGNDPGLDVHRTLFIQSFPERGPALFQEMLDRQAEIDQTGIILDDDMNYRIDTLIEQGAAEVRRRRAAEREEWDELGRRQHTVQEMLRDREQNLRDRERSFILQTTPVASPLEQIRELRLGLYQLSDIEEIARDFYPLDETELLDAIDQANAERLQEIARLREQIEMAWGTFEQRSGFADDTPHRTQQDEPRENEDTLAQHNETEQRLNEALALRRQALVYAYPFLVATEQWFSNGDQAIRETREEGEANRERTLEIQQQIDEFLARWHELAQLRTDIIQELLDIEHNMENARLEAVMRQEAPQMEQSNGLFESDPDWLLNFDDWCADNSNLEVPFTEIALRQDINGWFQHLRTCPSQARLDWMPIAEICRDAIMEGDRCHYDYVPHHVTPASGPLISFRKWCLENADPNEIAISPMNSIFINLLQEYGDYLTSAGAFAELAEFRYDRQDRVGIMRGHLNAMPGAPLSRELNDIYLIADTPSNLQLCVDIRRITIRRGLTTEADIRQRQVQICRFLSLRQEAIAVREGSLPGYRIERNERETRVRVEQERARHEREEETGGGDDSLSLAPLNRQL
jgi:hypothetical protein